MAKIHCQINVTNKDWRFVYSSVLNFFNQEIRQAYTHAVNFYNANSINTFPEIQSAFVNYVFQEKINEYQLSLMKSALFSGTNSKLYKPKGNNFKALNNRSKQLSTETFSISFDKSIRQISFLTSSFDNFDNFIASNTFISEFINMVNTVNWPTRSGPNKTVKGCTMVLLENGSGQIFYKSGPNPPVLEIGHQDITVDEPNILKSDMVKNIKLISNNPEETSQPTPYINEDLGDF